MICDFSKLVLDGEPLEMANHLTNEDFSNFDFIEVGMHVNEACEVASEEEAEKLGNLYEEICYHLQAVLSREIEASNLANAILDRNKKEASMKDAGYSTEEIEGLD